MTETVTFGAATSPGIMATAVPPDMDAAKKLNDAITAAMELYNKALTESQSAAQSQFEKAYSGYATGLQTLQEDLQKQSIEALRKDSTQSEFKMHWPNMRETDFFK